MNLLTNLKPSNKMLVFTNVAVSLYFLTTLMFKGSHNIGFALLVATGIVFSLVQLFKKQPFQLTSWDKKVALSFAFYVFVFLLSVIVSGGKMRDIDNPSRALLVIPLILLFAKYPPRLSWLLTLIPCGAVIAGIVAIIHRFVLNYPSAFMHQMQIQGGG